MEEKKIMAFKDEDGNKIEFEVFAEIYLDEETEKEKKYLLLAPIEDEESDNIFAFRVDIVDGNEEYNFVEDKEEFDRVQKVYKNLLY
ncbi:MAG: DUF1292 domain-containing protein [Sarcina sp.]